MDTFVALLVYLQAFGAIVGAGSAVLAELAYARAMRDGHVDKAERAHLDILARGLRWGMTFLLLSSFGLVVSAYQAGVPLQPALTTSYWSFIALALLATSVSYALSRGRISFSLGSAVVFTAWWFLAYLALGQLPTLSFGAVVAFYVVATGFFYGLLRLLRHLMTLAAWRTTNIV